MDSMNNITPQMVKTIKQLREADYNLWPYYQIDWETLEVVESRYSSIDDWPEQDNWAGSPEQAWA